MRFNRSTHCIGGKEFLVNAPPGRTFALSDRGQVEGLADGVQLGGVNEPAIRLFTGRKWTYSREPDEAGDGDKK